MPKIKFTVLGVARDGDRVLLGECYNPADDRLFYRPVGGRMEFGETMEMALIREFDEELGIPIRVLTPITFIEGHHYSYGGKRRHEVSQVYNIALTNPDDYHRSHPRIDDLKVDRSAVWLALSDVLAEDIPVYPAGLLDHLVNMPIRDAVGGGINRLHHVQITVPPDQVEAAREFYCGLLGLPETPKPDSLINRGGFWVQVGDQQVHVGIEDGFDRHQTKAHIAYQVDGLEHWRAKLLLHGINVKDSIPIPGFHRFECRDPFGNRVEFIEPSDD